VQLTFQNSFEEQKTFQSCSLFTSGCFNVQIKIGMIYLNAYKNKLLLSRDQDGTFEKKECHSIKRLYLGKGTVDDTRRKNI
jgi:hypothetical protein